MTVCRYFLQGNCRFGDRCRFEHVEENTDSYNNQNRYQNQYSRPSYVPRNSNQRDYYGGYSNEHYDTYRTESLPRYPSNSQAPDRGYYYDNRSDAYEGPRYSNQNQDRYYDKDYKRNYRAYNQYSENSKYGHAGKQNQYKWSKEEHSNKQHEDSYPKSYEGDFSSSTPKGAKSFSFKVPESEIKKETTVKLNEQDQLTSEIVKEDSKFAEHGGVWPFSSYFPIPSKPGFPGFFDISPEELRYAAYTAEKNNNFPAYTKAVQNLLEKVNLKRADLQIPTPQLINTLRRIWNGEDLCVGDETLASIPYLNYGQTGVENSASVLPAKNSAAFFSFKAASETDSVKSAAAAFSFKDSAHAQPTSSTAAFSFKDAGTTQPVSSVAAFSFKDSGNAQPFSSAAAFSFKDGSKPFSSAAFGIKDIKAAPGDDEIYTPMEILTDDEIEQFRASTFVLGKIPTKPPPKVLCL